MLRLREFCDVAAGVLDSDKLATSEQRNRIVERGRFQPRSATMRELASKFVTKGYERGSKRLVLGVGLSLIFLCQPH